MTKSSKKNVKKRIIGSGRSYFSPRTKMCFIVTAFSVAALALLIGICRYNLTNKVSEGRTNDRLIMKKLLRSAPELIDELGLRGKTLEEIRKEVYVDFSALNAGHKFPAHDKNMRAKIMLNMQLYALLPREIREPIAKLHPSDRRKYDLDKFNNGIVALGVENFMMAATKFCEEEAAAGEIPIVSIGSGDGSIEREIIVQYRERFGKEIRIQLVDPDPKFYRIVDFNTVDHLIRENPRIVGNCVALIIWPNPEGNLLEVTTKDDHYDIEAIRKLQPKAVLTVYESAGSGGSDEFCSFLHDDSLDELSPQEFGIKNWMAQLAFYKKRSYGLDNYSVLEVARQKVFLQESGTFIYRLVKIIRKNLNS